MHGQTNPPVNSACYGKLPCLLMIYYIQNADVHSHLSLPGGYIYIYTHTYIHTLYIYIYVYMYICMYI